MIKKRCTISNLTAAEQEQQNTYIARYKKNPPSISKNHGKSFYNLFELDFSNQQCDIPHFDKVHSKVMRIDKAGTQLESLPKEIQNILQLKDKSVLDFGCGLGEFVHDIVENFGTTKAYGIDLASVELALTSKYESDKCIFKSGGATYIDLPDDSVDIVTAFLSLEHVHSDNIDTLISEFCRVCKSGFIFQISHKPKSKGNMRLTSERFPWWYDKFEPHIDQLYLYHFPKDDYKWDVPPRSKLTRWICTIKENK